MSIANYLGCLASAVLCAYLIGSIPFGLLIGFMKGVDIRTQGSCNIGATNVTRVVGKIWGKLCFVCDFLKGLLPVLAVHFIWNRYSGQQEQTLQSGILISLTAMGTVLGHIFPLYLKFKGGKGVSTAAGAVMALNPLSVVIAAMVWVLTFFTSRYVSLASIAAAIALPLAAWLLIHAGIPMSLPVGILLIFFAVLTIWRHRSNIQRLLNGTESRFEKKKTETK
ncbi:MAG: glycerol-3-phosphate 1-O-acyltransferase PlsY [Lentisphaeria bacterium]|nr:glycerol-3-phosphate 1-O-acyltransferase PlsY [Lentisphaeria bacterium]